MTQAASPPHMIAKGVALIIATAFLISAQDVVYKGFAGDMVLWQIFALRGLFALPLLIAISALQHQARPMLTQAATSYSLLRATCFTATFLVFYAALPFVSLATAGAGVYLAPIFVVVMSARILQEPVGPTGWIAVALGFAGVVVMLRPWTDTFSAWSLLPILAACFYATGHLVTRRHCQHLSGPALSFSLNAMMTAAGLGVSVLLLLWPVPTPEPYIFGPWAAMSGRDWLTLLVLAVGAITIGATLANAYKAAPPAIIATFEYSYLIFAAIWDATVFNIAPTTASLSGMAMITLAGILALRRD